MQGEESRAVEVEEDAVVGTGGEAARLQQAGGGEEVVGAAVQPQVGVHVRLALVVQPEHEAAKGVEGRQPEHPGADRRGHRGRGGGVRRRRRPPWGRPRRGRVVERERAADEGAEASVQRQPPVEEVGVRAPHGGEGDADAGGRIVRAERIGGGRQQRGELGGGGGEADGEVEQEARCAQHREDGDVVGLRTRKGAATRVRVVSPRRRRRRRQAGGELRRTGGQRATAAWKRRASATPRRRIGWRGWSRRAPRASSPTRMSSGADWPSAYATRSGIATPLGVSRSATSCSMKTGAQEWCGERKDELSFQKPAAK